MVVVFGEDQGLGYDGAAGEDVGEEPVAERFEDEADLGFAGDVSVELACGVFEVFVEFFEPLLSGSTVLFRDCRSGLDG